MHEHMHIGMGESRWLKLQQRKLKFKSNVFTIAKYTQTIISCACPYFFSLSVHFYSSKKIWLLITPNTRQQLSGALWGGSSITERGPTYKHFVLALWIVTDIPGSANFTHMTLIKISRGRTHLLWGQSVITSIGTGSPTNALKQHK